MREGLSKLRYLDEDCCHVFESVVGAGREQRRTHFIAVYDSLFEEQEQEQPQSKQEGNMATADEKPSSERPDGARIVAEISGV
jgi:hypothetical protein